MPSSELLKLKAIASADQQKLKQWNSDLGLASSIMTKEEEQKLVDYVKANTNNPEKVTTAITRLQEVMGNKATAEFLDRSGLGLHRALFATNSFALQSDIATAVNGFNSNKTILQSQYDDTKLEKIGERIRSNKVTQKLMSTLTAASGNNASTTAASIESSIKALTYQNIVKDKMDWDTAVEKAAERVAGEFDIVNDKPIGGSGRYFLYSKKGGMGDKNRVEKWVKERALTKEYLEKNALVVGEEFKKRLQGVRRTPQEIRAKWSSFIQQNAVLTTNEGGDGVRLMYRDPDTQEFNTSTH